MEVIPGIESYLPVPDREAVGITYTMEKLGVVGYSKAIIQTFLQAEKAAKSNANILIEGESGTGKEVFAQAIHALSRRNFGPFVKINCAEIPEMLLESELFGYEKGAFTGAQKRKIGKFELANQGTIFLDEISEMSLSLQAKMLRVIEDKTISRVGGLETIPVDVRVIAATNRKLWQYVKEGKFREDLYYRLNVVSLSLPPLRQRREDIPLLMNHFLHLYQQEEGVRIREIDPQVVKIFLQYEWSGNVRQLENAIHHAIIMTTDDVISIEDIPQQLLQQERIQEESSHKPLVQKEDLVITSMDLDELEKQQIIRALDSAHWRISRAAQLLGIHRNTLTQKMKRLGIK
ncbi:sigma-54 interaction domain-containing protein [Thermospira aquatica]|uniref:Sigma-54-dependent Fis family transcriptional regulator n=1 Tax=Thermospira aquatica TaxID=2828656 RepID=A0AAX3BEX9_9SPIR|nr:sigma-54 dependent transcriptional regulator [Thermospira aquatica]URA10690.1 sigma-54-dependent Fis family transcriptional regulator [Thermospira aquatica]